MKRTFGRFMSLLLVLAMVLAMVPAALAANGTYIVEPGAAITIKTSLMGFTVTKWESSDMSVATVEPVSGSTTEATVTGVKASNTAVRITATGKVNGRDYSEYFTVYVADVYSLTLTLNNSAIGSSAVALNEGDTRTLTATVTLPYNWNAGSNLENCEVHFTSDNTSVISVSPASAKVTASTVGRYTTYKVEATVKAALVGGATVTAWVYYKNSSGQMVPSTSANATKAVGFRVSGRATVSVTLPEAQQTLSLEASGKTATLQPKVSGYSGTTQPRLMYLYDTTGNNLYVRPNTATTSATVEPYKACAATKIYICIEGYNIGKTYNDVKDDPEHSITGSYAVCTVSIRNKDMSVTSMEVRNDQIVTYNGNAIRLQKLLDNGTMVFGLQDSYYKPAAVSAMIRSPLELTAHIKAPDSLLASAADLENAYSRIEWKSSNPAVAKIDYTKSDSTSAFACIKPVAVGTATITAKVDDNVTATYNVTVYQGRSYQITEEPSIGEMVSKMTDDELLYLFKKESAKVEIQTSVYSNDTMTCYLPVKTAAVLTDTNGGKRFQYTLNGLKKDTKEFFYNRNDPDGAGVMTSKDVTFSDITFTEQPVGADYKLSDTFADLAMSASISTSPIKSVVWYMNSDQTSDSADKVILTEIVSGSYTAYRSVLSNLKQYISGAGTYVFYCRVTTSDGKYADTRKAIISVNGENHIAITISPTSVRAGETFTITGVPQDYVNGKLVDVTGKSYTIAWSSSDENIVKFSSKTTTNSSPSVTATAKAGGQVTIKAETTIGAKKYAAEKTIFVTVPESPSASITIVPVCGKAGEKVRVPVILENNPGFADLSIEIDYDSAVVELTDVQPNNEVGGNFTPAQNYTVRPYVLNWVKFETK